MLTILQEPLQYITNFEWIEECQVSFKDLKQYLGSLKHLTRPNTEGTLFLYLGVSQFVVNAVVFKEVESKHKQIYYVNRFL